MPDKELTKVYAVQSDWQGDGTSIECISELNKGYYDIAIKRIEDASKTIG